MVLDICWVVYCLGFLINILWLNGFVLFKEKKVFVIMFISFDFDFNLIFFLFEVMKF